MARALLFAVALPDGLRRQIDAAALEDRITRGEFVRRAVVAEFARRTKASRTRGTEKRRNDDAA